MVGYAELIINTYYKILSVRAVILYACQNTNHLYFAISKTWNLSMCILACLVIDHLMIYGTLHQKMFILFIYFISAPHRVML